MQSFFIFFSSSAVERRQCCRYRCQRTIAYCARSLACARWQWQWLCKCFDFFASITVWLLLSIHHLFNCANDFEILLLYTKYKKKRHYLMWFILICRELVWRVAFAEEKLEKEEEKNSTKLWHRTEQTSLLSLCETNCWGVCIHEPIRIYRLFVVILYLSVKIEREREKLLYNVDVMKNELNSMFSFFSNLSWSIVVPYGSFSISTFACAFLLSHGIQFFIRL